MAEETVQGTQHLLGKLGDIGSLVTQKKILVRALREGSEPIRVRAAELAPDDPATPGSRIREGMMITIVEQTATEAISKIGPSKKAFFGSFAEFGTIRQRATPFMRPAFDEKRDEAMRVVGAALSREIEAEAAR